MSFEAVAYLLALACAGVFYATRVGFNLSLSSVLLGLLLLFHGPAYLYYTRWWGPETDFYWQILESAPTVDVIGRLDLALALTFAGVCLGIALVDAATGRDRSAFDSAFEDWSRAPLEVAPGVAEKVRVAGIAGLALLLAFAVADNHVGKVIEYITADLGEFEKIALRRELGGSGQYLFNLLLGNVLPFVAFCLVLLQGSRAPMPLLAAAFAAALLLGKLATLSKAPPAIFVLQLLVLGVVRRSLHPSQRGAALLAACGTALFCVMAVVAIPALGDVWDALEFLFYRAFMVVNEGLMEYFAAIPFLVPHTDGLQSGWVAALLGEEAVEPAYWVVAETIRGAAGSTSTVMFMGDAWADFGWTGVVLAAVFAGALVRWLDVQLIIRRGKSVATAAGLALGHYGIFVAFSTALQTALLTGGLLLVLPLVALLEGGRERPGAAPAAATGDAA